VRYALGEGNDPANGNKPRTEPKGEQSRVAWTSGQNFGFAIESREDADLARRMMEFMALNQTSRTKLCEKDCLHLSLGWRPGEEPTREQMEEAARSALAALGMGNARALFVAHNDESYSHVHVVASKINPDTGRAYDLKGNFITLSKWAEKYEREHSGGIVCSRREEANQLRDAIAKRDAAAVLELMVQQRATFTGKQLESALAKQIKSAFERAQFAEKILGQAVRLADEAGGKTTRYTTQAVLDAERQVIRAADGLARNREHDTGEANRVAVMKRKEFATISGEQAAAFRHATGAEGIALIDGQAGTGKSFTLRAVRQAYESAGCRVIGLAPTNAVAQDMQRDGFARGATVHSELFTLANNRTAWNRRTVVIVDEAAMIDTKLMMQLATRAHEAGAKLILVGDDRQLSSIDRGGMFGVLKDRHGAAELKQVRRQGKPDERRAAEMLAEGNFQSALEIYDGKGAIHWTRNQDEARAALVAQWTKDSAAQPDKGRFVFAYTNADVDRLNQDLRAVRKERGELGGDDREFQTKHGSAAFAARDRIQFTGTDKGKGLTNGAAGTIERIEGDIIAVRLDGRAGKSVEFDAKEFQDFRHGYAGTIYKGQGRTLDQTYLYHSEHWRSAASYVGLTRHRDATALFVARNTAEDVKQLARQMARVDDRRAASHFHTQGEEPAPVPPPRAGELKAELDRLMGDISRQLGEKAKTPAPARSGFENWADSPGLVAQERSAMRAARAHAPPSAAPQTPPRVVTTEAAKTAPSPMPPPDPLAELARIASREEPPARDAALARLFDQPQPAKTAPPAPDAEPKRRSEQPAATPEPAPPASDGGRGNAPAESPREAAQRERDERIARALQDFMGSSSPTRDRGGGRTR
jgi:Ti-type conjugative transfer relaxase TraA